MFASKETSYYFLDKSKVVLIFPIVRNSTNHAQLRSLDLEISDEFSAKNKKREIVEQTS